MNFQEFGLTVAKLRKSKKISQKELADAIGISRATISSFENGHAVDIGFRKVLHIADYLGETLKLKEKSKFPTFEELKNE